MFARLLALLLLSVPFAATAEVFDDGGDHVLDWTTTEMVEVDAATRLELVAGGVIAPAGDSNGLQTTGGSTIVLSGGSIEAGAGPGPRIGLASWSCDVTISGPVVIQGGLSTGSTGGKGAHIDSPSPHFCLVEDGQLLGRDNAVSGGPGATLAGEIEIRGGSFVGGNGVAAGGGIGLWFLRGNGTLEPAEVLGGDGASNGGSALIVSAGAVEIAGGTFRGGSGSQSGGSALKASGGAQVVVRGGSFVAGEADGVNERSVSATDGAVIEIHGGSFDSRFLVFGEETEIFVHGTGFTTDGSGSVIGTLADGTPISVGVWTLDGGKVTLIETVATETTSFGELKARF